MSTKKKKGYLVRVSQISRNAYIIYEDLVCPHAPNHEETNVTGQISRENLRVSDQRAMCVNVIVMSRKSRMRFFLAQCGQLLQDIPHFFFSLCQGQAASDEGPKLCGYRR